MAQKVTASWSGGESLLLSGQVGFYDLVYGVVESKPKQFLG